jgi:hypothetical protein
MRMDKPPEPGKSIKVLIYEAEGLNTRHDKLGEIIIEPNPESSERKHLEAFRSLGLVK